jgi:ethanolamine utilization protein EutN
MILGQVVGSVVSTQKDANLIGKTLLIVKSIDLAGNLLESLVVAVDIVGVGIGENVLVVSGSSARQTDLTRDRAIDAAIVAKVDSYTYEK